MPLPRVIPCLLFRAQGLVKTERFKKPVYLGDPINIVRIFNDKEVDELVFLDITATREQRGPNVKTLAEISSECFMPLAYGGGISSIQQMQELFSLGIEKIVLNSHALENPALVQQAAEKFGSQSIVISIDAKQQLFGRHRMFSHCGTHKTPWEPAAYASKMQAMGAGEILLNSINRDGTMQGYDLALISKVASAVDIPVVACGGAGKLQDLRMAIAAGASAVAAGSFFVFQGPHRAVLIHFPSVQELQETFRVDLPLPT